MRNFRRSTLLLQLFFFFAAPAELPAQSYEYPYEIDQYDFVRYDLNRFEFFNDSTPFMEMFRKFDRLLLRGDGQLSVVHIGGSHLQADVYPDRIRKRLQTFQPGLNGGRGFIFPYRVARTTNPSNFKVYYSGKWTACRNVEEYRYCKLGLSGISVTTIDPRASITFCLPENQAVNYDFNKVMVFFEEDSFSYDMVIDAKAVVEELPGEGSTGIKVFRLDRYTDSLSIRLQQGDSLQGRFTLYGISLQTDDPGIVYHSIGINGAKVSSFMRCQLLEEHLKALNPQLVILSLGTNDGYTRYFRYEPFRMEYDSLINRIGKAVPGAAILLTVPNDSYLYRRYINRNTEEIKKAIFELAQVHNAGVWDFYDVMGGLNSIIVWQHYGLAKRDRIHFTGKGYRLQGDLFFNALLQSYDNYLDRKVAGK